MSKLPFELLLALRYLRPKRTFVSIITLISVIGVSLGVAVLIIVISVMSGFDRDLREKVFGFSAHLRVLPAGEGTMENYAQLAATVASNRNVTGVAPFVMGQIFIETQPAHGEAMILAPAVRGIDPEAERRVSALATNVVAGRFDVARREGRNGLLIGTVLAGNLHLDVGDRVSVYSHKQLRRLREAQRDKREIAISPDEYEIRGIFEAGLQEFNAMVVITSLETAQELQGLDESDSVQGLTVAIHDPLQAPQVARELTSALGGDCAVTTWLEDSPLMMAVAVEKNMMLYLLFFIVLVAAFGITCTLITFIMMKTREIGLMKAIGASNAQVMRVFVAQSLIVSFLGIVAGIGLGLLAVAYRNEFLEFMRRTTGAQLFPAEIYQFSQLPALVLPGDLAIICGGSLLICLLAAALPAWHASRLNPVEALRNE
jgi:lipoprotein-releasing system permease protein